MSPAQQHASNRTNSTQSHHAHHNNTYSNWFSWLGWLSYSFQHVSLANVHTRLLYLSSVSLANVLVGACLYRCVSGKAFSACLVKTYAVLFRAPGVGVFNEDTLAASLVLNLMFIFGLFVFACLLGMITDEIKLQLHAIRAGEVKLPLWDHVVVLNWNRQALSLLKQLSHAQADSHSRLYKRPIVVLAEPSKLVLDAAVAAVFKGSNQHQLRLFCRSGQPSKARDLERVAAEAAHAVILLHPEGTSKAAADALKAQALISLTCLREQVLGRDPAAQATSTGAARLLRCVSAAAHAACRASTAVVLRLAASRSRGRSRTSSFGHSSSHRRSDSSCSMRIVVQTGGSQPCGQQQHEPDVIGFLQEATASRLHNSSIQQVQLLSQSTLDRLVCQTAVEPGVATVFRELVRAGGDVHLEWCEVGGQLAGSYSSAAGMLQACVLLGVLEAESKLLTLNPPDHLLLQPGDRLVALTRQGILNTSTPATSTCKPQHPALLKRTVSRVSSMASPQLASLATAHHSSDGGGSSSGCSSPTAASRAAAKPGSSSSSQGQRVVVLGWLEAAVPELLLQLQEALPLGSSVTVLLPLPAAGNPTAQQQQQQQQKQKQAPVSPTAPQVQFMQVADPGSVQALLGAGIADADTVMLGPALSPKAAPGSMEADALVTSTVLAVQQALQTVSGGVAGPMSHHARSHLGACWQQQQQRSSKLHVVAVVSSYSVRRALQTFLSSVLLRVNFSYEICLMEEFAAGMLVSVALEVANSLVIDQLLLNPRSGGLGIWSLHKLGLDGSQQLTWADVNQAARQCRCTALGYRRADGGMVLVPSASASVTPADRVVVLSSTSSRGSRGGGCTPAVWR